MEIVRLCRRTRSETLNPRSLDRHDSVKVLQWAVDEEKVFAKDLLFVAVEYCGCDAHSFLTLETLRN